MIELNGWNNWNGLEIRQSFSVLKIASRGYLEFLIQKLKDTHYRLLKEKNLVFSSRRPNLGRSESHLVELQFVVLRIRSGVLRIGSRMLWIQFVSCNLSCKLSAVWVKQFDRKQPALLASLLDKKKCLFSLAIEVVREYWTETIEHCRLAKCNKMSIGIQQFQSFSITICQDRSPQSTKNSEPKLMNI